MISKFSLLQKFGQLRRIQSYIILSSQRPFASKNKTYKNISDQSMQDLEKLVQENIKNKSVAKMEEVVDEQEPETELQKKIKEQLKKDSDLYNFEPTGESSLSLDDDRKSGDEASDNEMEFQSIVDMQTAVEKLQERKVDIKEIQEEAVKLFDAMLKIREVLDINKSIKEIVANLIAREMLYFDNFSHVIHLAEIAYKIKLPIKEFWNGLQNIVLLNYNDMELNHIVQILYYIQKMNICTLELDVSLLEEGKRQKADRLAKYANHQLLIQYLTDQIQNVLPDLNSALHDDPIFKQMLYLLVKDNFITGIKKIMTTEQLKKSINDLSKYLLENIEGMNFLLSNYSYELIMDFLLLSSNENFNLQSFEIFSVILSTLADKKKFFLGRQPTLSDLNVILDKVQHIKKQGEMLTEQNITAIQSVCRTILQKAIVNEKQYDEEDKKQEESAENKQSQEITTVNKELTELQKRQLKDDLEFIKVLRKYDDLQLLDNQAASLVFFELSTQIAAKHPFNSEDEAYIKLSLLQYALQKFEPQNDRNQQFLDKFIKNLRYNIYENDKFDEHLNVNEYLIIREITNRLIQLKGKTDELKQQAEYVERKIFNYSKLNSI